MVKINPNSTYMKVYDWKHVINPITDEQLTTWLEALRSDKYAQAKGALKDEILTNNTCSIGFCCLGVFNEIIPNEEIASKDFLKKYIGAVGVIYTLPEDIQGTLAEMNDDGSTFSEIADEIEKGFTEDYDPTTEEELEEYLEYSENEEEY